MAVGYIIQPGRPWVGDPCFRPFQSATVTNILKIMTFAMAFVMYLKSCVGPGTSVPASYFSFLSVSPNVLYLVLNIVSSLFCLIPRMIMYCDQRKWFCSKKQHYSLNKVCCCARSLFCSLTRGTCGLSGQITNGVCIIVGVSSFRFW